MGVLARLDRVLGPGLVVACVPSTAQARDVIGEINLAVPFFW